MRLALLCALLLGCAPYRHNIILDVSAGGGEDKSIITSAGVNYPLIGELWGTLGAWRDLNGAIGGYWGVSYSWAPFKKPQ